jgi:RimJ/RimL family protein N-acetyltransferase
MKDAIVAAFGDPVRAMRITIGPLELGRFTADDTDALYAVRNHPDVRRYMADPRPLAYERHVEWVQRHLVAGTDHCLFVVRWDGEPTGFTVLKRLGPATAEIGAMFRAPDRHRVVIAYATVATLDWGYRGLGVTTLSSWIVPTHTRAMDWNRAFGAWEVPSTKPGLVEFHQTREVALAHPTFVKIFARVKDRMVVTGPCEERW